MTSLAEDPVGDRLSSAVPADRGENLILPARIAFRIPTFNGLKGP